MSKQLNQLFFICIVSTLISSCTAPTYKFYEGNGLPPEKIAILSNTLMDKNVKIYIVDGKKDPDPILGKHFYGSKWDGGFRIELLPGKHTLSLGYNNNYDIYSINYKEISFNAEAGEEYTVKAQAIDVGLTSENILNNRHWKAWIIKTRDISK
jgi:hypothetical protein